MINQDVFLKKQKILDVIFLCSLLIIIISMSILMSYGTDFYELIRENDILIYKTNRVLDLNADRIEKSYSKNDVVKNTELKIVLEDINKLNDTMYINKEELFTIKFLPKILPTKNKLIKTEEKAILLEKLLELDSVLLELRELETKTEMEKQTYRLLATELLYDVEIIDNRKVFNTQFEWIIINFLFGNFSFLVSSILMFNVNNPHLKC